MREDERGGCHRRSVVKGGTGSEGSTNVSHLESPTGSDTKDLQTDIDISPAPLVKKSAFYFSQSFCSANEY